MIPLDVCLSLLFCVSISQSTLSNTWHKRWTSSNAGSSFASEALICDLNLDSKLELFAATVDGELVMLDLSTGQAPEGSHWPIYRHGEHFLSQPFLYDIDHNGEEEVVFLSLSGEFSAYNWHGVHIHSWSMPPVFIKRNWFVSATSLIDTNLDKAISFSRESDDVEYSKLSPHIWSSGRILDYNQDSRLEELVLAMNYMGQESRMNASHVLAVLMVYNLSSSNPFITLPLELTKSSSEYPSYALSNVQIADLVNYVPGLEVIVTTSSGMLYVISTKDSKIISGYPIEYGPIENSPVLVPNLSRSRHLSVVLSDVSGNVWCIDSTGKTVWEFTNKGSPVTRPISLGNKLVFGDKSGHVYVLDSNQGSILPGFPIKFDANFTIEPIVLPYDVTDYAAFLSSHGDVFMVDVNSPNFTAVETLKEPSFLPLQRLPPRTSSDVLLLSKDGVLIRYTPKLFGRVHKPDSSHQLTQHDVLLTSHVLSWKHSSYTKATGTYLTLDFTILDDGARQNNLFLVKIYLAELEVYSSKISYQIHQTIRLKVDEAPFRGRLTLIVISPDGFVYSDSTFVALNWHFLLHLSHLLYLPAFCLLGGLLILTITRESENLLPIIARPANARIRR